MTLTPLKLWRCAGWSEHLTRLTWYVTDMPAYLDSLKELGHVYRQVIGSHYPAMALVGVTALVFADAKVEIEATAVVPRTPPAQLHEPAELRTSD